MHPYAPRVSCAAAAALLCALCALCAFCASCCGSVDPSHWSGTLNYSVAPTLDGSAGDAGAGATVTGSTGLSITLAPYQPWVTDDLSSNYCGPSSFTVDLGTSCSLTAHIGSSSAPSSASIDAGQTCALELPGGFVSFVVGSGTVVWSRPGINVTLGGPGANLEFEGS